MENIKNRWERENEICEWKYFKTNNWIYFTFFFLYFSSAVSLKTFLYCYSGIYTTWKVHYKQKCRGNSFVFIKQHFVFKVLLISIVYCKHFSMLTFPHSISVGCCWLVLSSNVLIHCTIFTQNNLGVFLSY